LSINVSNDSGDDPKGQLARELTGELLELSMALDLIGNAAASRIGINQTDLICLTLLARRGPMSPGQIASALGLTTAAISAMASRLEAGGYAEREIDPSDRRRIVMRASPAGVQQAFGLFDDFFQATVDSLTSTSQADLRKVIALLVRFRGILTEHAARIREGS
jgi:DNA-binding MarR family transcriptional regulator